MGVFNSEKLWDGNEQRATYRWKMLFDKKGIFSFYTSLEDNHLIWSGKQAREEEQKKGNILQGLNMHKFIINFNYIWIFFHTFYNKTNYDKESQIKHSIRRSIETKLNQSIETKLKLSTQ